LEAVFVDFVEAVTFRDMGLWRRRVQCAVSPAMQAFFLLNLRDGVYIKIVKSEVAFFAITLMGRSKEKTVSSVIDE
jgi:hypothetical protein